MSRRLALAGALAVTSCAHPHHVAVRNLIAEPDRTTTTTTAETSSPMATLPASAERSTQRRVSRSAVRSRVSAAAALRPGAGSTQDVWDRLAMCESGNTNDHNPPYYGYWQFDLRTWHGNGGSGRPDEHTRAEQLAVAQLLHARRGWAPWPGCTRRLGLVA